ncbi:GNAT family N-acetyltransferase [Dichotomicrobium thermohalophilum]|uniref:Acetyltransferase (GNAT) family protein n=1 Tax=Dichotomicrobium thermohalophilum TaxID=933063 RepID=A0A397PCV0_9HYPH|nr:GNAT family N-acetyltransferase [Dichotomicrobium thermohalophilum]RIA47326.1 acetyltransferase (GNAT) family protein [Dichotomicrobium thermohalophilum]
MDNLQRPFRRARPEDAPLLAELINNAGEGLPLHLWRGMAGESESGWDVGVARARRETGGFSYRNAIMIEADGGTAGCLIGYPIPEQVEPIEPDFPPLLRPLQELENLAPGTWYVNVLAVRPEARGRGLGGQLLALAEEIGSDTGARGMSVIVADRNTGAFRLYERSGYRQTAARAIVKNGWSVESDNWLLMTKSF